MKLLEQSLLLRDQSPHRTQTMAQAQAQTAAAAATTRGSSTGGGASDGGDGSWLDLEIGAAYHTLGSLYQQVLYNRQVCSGWIQTLYMTCSQGKRSEK